MHFFVIFIDDSPKTRYIMEEKSKVQDELQYLIDISRLQGFAKNQKQFAEMVGLDPAPLSAMLSGSKKITSQMMKRIKDAVTAAGVVIEGNGNATATAPGSTAQVISGDLSALIHEMGEQRRSYEEQLRAKDLQISEFMQLLKEAIGGHK
jgi:hypothetical protein